MTPVMAIRPSTESVSEYDSEYESESEDINDDIRCWVGLLARKFQPLESRVIYIDNDPKIFLDTVIDLEKKIKKIYDLE